MGTQKGGASGRLLEVGSGSFDAVSGELSFAGRTVRLRPRTAALLAHLLRHAGCIVTKDELMQAVWPDVVVTDDSIVHCVKEIRQALGPMGRDWIRTVPRLGYAFTAPATGEGQARRPALPWLAAVALGVVAALAWRPWAVPWTEQPSIVVMPIVNLTGEPARELAAQDLSESLASALARVPGMSVTSPSTAFMAKGRPLDARRVGEEFGVRYVLEGSLRGREREPLLTLRLVEAASARQLWSGELTPGGGMEALAGDVRTRVARTVSLHLTHAEAERAQPAHAPDPMAAGLLALARAKLRWAHADPEARVQARPLLEQALARDDRLAEAWALLAKTYMFDIRFCPQRERDLKTAADAVARALALEPYSLDGHLMQAWVHYESGRMTAALAEAEHALELWPDMPIALGLRGAALVMLGRPQEAVPQLDHAMRLSPQDPYLPEWLGTRGVAELHFGRTDEAVDWLAKAVERQPGTPGWHLFLAGALGAAGRTGDAQARMAQFQRLRPGFTLHELRVRERSDEPAFLRQRERLYAGLRAAGMPE